MPLVKAQCTNCNGMLEVDSSKDAAICPHCGTPYIVERAINNYGGSSDYERLVENGEFYLSAEKYDEAAKVYSEIVEKYPAKDVMNFYKKYLALTHNMDMEYFREQVKKIAFSIYNIYDINGYQPIEEAFNDFKTYSKGEHQEEVRKCGVFLGRLKELYSAKISGNKTKRDISLDASRRKQEEERQRAKEEEERIRAKKRVVPLLTIISGLLFVVFAGSGKLMPGVVCLGLAILFGLIWIIQNQYN